jgi:Ran GTPase-activating protein (RanGAP) involved in mRNA processing and transport
MRVYFIHIVIGSTKDGLQALGKTFSSSKSLAQIDLSRNKNIGNEGISCFVEAGKEHAGNEMVVFPSLEKMIVSECNIGPLGMQSLAEIFLGANVNRSKPIDLVLSSNPIGSEGCGTLAKLIALSGGGSILSSLHLSQCSIGDAGIKLLSNAATSNLCTGLTFLDLSENSIISDGARVFAGSLVNSWPSLVELKLAKNDLGSEGVTSMMGSLRTRSNGATDDAAKTKNRSLKNLDLTCTGCGKEGANAALNSACLTTLRLFNNRLGSEGFRSISAFLHGGHPSIENLDLGGNNAGEDAVIELLNAIADKVDDGAASKLSVLEIGGNKFGDKAMEALTKLKQVWPRLDVAHDKPIQEETDEVE